MKQTWNIIKDTLHRKTKCELPNQFFIGNRAVTNPDEIANEFNEYFVNIGRLLSKQIQWWQKQSGPFTILSKKEQTRVKRPNKS